MKTAREIDRVEGELIRQGLANFHVSGAGHEGTAILARHLMNFDWIHAHYRDKALLFARGLSIREFLRSSLCRRSSHSHGRQMSAHLSAPHLNVLSIVGPVGNNALQACGIAAAVKLDVRSPIVVCSVGDGTTQQGEFLEAVGEAVRSHLPVLFLIENNRYSISTCTTGQTFFDRPDGDSLEFWGIPITRVDGFDVCKADSIVANEISIVRNQRVPRIILFEVERLENHTNADDQTTYRSREEINSARDERDPITKLRKTLIQSGILKSSLSALDFEIQDAVKNTLSEVLSERDESLVDSQPNDSTSSQLDRYNLAKNKQFEGKSPSPSETDSTIQGITKSPEKLTIREAINGVLREQLNADQRVFLFGQDIEDPKGDVFGVTRGLSSQFPGRVINAPLSESTILGVSIGRALAGQRPVAFIQFADFIPLAFNQIINELATMSWRTGGSWKCPVILIAAAGGYKPGLGPFHSQTMDGILGHIPGINLFFPSSGPETATILREAFQADAPSILLYPKALLNNLQAQKSPRNIGLRSTSSSRYLRSGNDLTIVSWGNTVPICLEAADLLEKNGVFCDLYDLFRLSSWDQSSVLRSANRTQRLLVVHEDNRTGGFGAEIVAEIIEKSACPIRVQRVARRDSFLPCNYADQLESLPSVREVVEASAILIDHDVVWFENHSSDQEAYAIKARGSGPADHVVTIADLRVRLGETVAVGDVVADIEATKAVIEIASEVSGTVIEICHEPGEEVAVGSTLLRIKCNEEITPARECSDFSKFTNCRLVPRRNTTRETLTTKRSTSRDGLSVQLPFLSNIEICLGRRVIQNCEVLKEFPTSTSDDWIKRSGIASRRWADESQTLLSMATEAGAKLLDREGVSLDAIDLVIAATSTPDLTTPSLAMRIIANLKPGRRTAIGGFDINAACSGYLYALSEAWNFVAARPRTCVLVVTSELLSRRINRRDFATAGIFADGATATLVVGPECTSVTNCSLLLHRPFIGGMPDAERAIEVPANAEPLRMNGNTVFSQAVRAMLESVRQVCREEGFEMEDLAGLIPHQANQRILDAVASRCRLPVMSQIREIGNTSSSSIPITLHFNREAILPGQIWGLTSFGGGFTYAAALVQKTSALKSNIRNSIL